MKADNWRTLLAHFIDGRRSRPFVWGQHDCCLFAADWVALATGQDPAASWRGLYDSALSAHRIAAPFGGIGGLVIHALKASGAVYVDAKRATAGDIIIRDSELGDVTGVVVGRDAAFVAEFGLTFAAITDDPYAEFWRF